MFISSLILIRTLPCLDEPGKIIVIGKPSSVSMLRDSLEDKQIAVKNTM